MTHRLEPLLRPRSIAVIGASARPATMGFLALHNLIAGGFEGKLYPVNPGYDAVQGLTCFRDLESLPETPDLAIFCVADTRIESVLEDVITAGVRAVLIMSTLVVDDDSSPVLRERIRKRIKESGIVACGGNGMGFYNVDARISACGFDARRHEPPGRATLISHSGSGMCSITDSEERIRFNLVVSTGNELDATMDEYLDYALDMPTTKVVGLFVETARNPEGMKRALDKANRMRIPVLAVKVGRTEKSAALTVSHSGAIAGDDATYDALFDKYGVQRFKDLDELATALILFSEWSVPGDGSLVSLHDSGGERQLMVDLADEQGVPLCELTDDTTKALEAILEPELPAVNPLDGWSRGGADASAHMTQYISLMLQDPGAAVGLLVLARAPSGAIYPEYVEHLRRAHSASGKPVALVAARQGSGSDLLATATTHAGYPVLDDVSNVLTSIRAMFLWRDFLQQQDDAPPTVPPDVVSRWKGRLATRALLSEAEGLEMLHDFGISASQPVSASTQEDVRAAGARIGYPLVLKTAAKGISHKSDVGGVSLNLGDESALISAYQKMSATLGPDVIVSKMLAAGVELIFGTKWDEQFGPVVIIGFGGIHAEILRDVVFALPPFGPRKARTLLDRLKMRRLLDGVRGAKAVDMNILCNMAAQFSAMVDSMRQDVREIDVNPIIATHDSITAVDALIVSGKQD